MAVKKSDRKVVRLWTSKELSILKKEYPKTDTKLLASKLKRTLEAVRFQAKKLGLKKTKNYMASLYSSPRKSKSRKPTPQRKTANRKTASVNSPAKKTSQKKNASQ